MKPVRVVDEHNIGSLVRELPELRGLRQTRLSSRAKLGQPTISKVEQGARMTPIPTLMKLLSALSEAR
jgi:transcriptional regulator with XRE-family HTH domain